MKLKTPVFSTSTDYGQQLFRPIIPLILGSTVIVVAGTGVRVGNRPGVGGVTGAGVGVSKHSGTLQHGSLGSTTNRQLFGTSKYVGHLANENGEQNCMGYIYNN